jgi:hypothetical protein
MLLEAIGSGVLGLILTLFEAIPLGTLEVPSFGPMVGLVRELNGFLPVAEVIDYVKTVLQVVLVLLGLKVVVFVYSLIPLKAS